METTERKLSSAQLACLVFILGMSLKLLILPILLIKSSGRDATLSFAALLSIDLVMLALMITAIVLAPEKSFCELLEGLIGKWAAKAVYAVLAVYFFFKLVLLSGDVQIFFSEGLLPDLHWTLYSIPFFAMCALIGAGTVRAIGRTAQMIVLFVGAAIIMTLVLISAGVDFSLLLPIKASGLKNVPKDLLRYSMWYGDFTVLAAFIGSIKRTRKTYAVSIIAGVISALSVMFFALSLIASFSDIADIIRFGQNISGLSLDAIGNEQQGRFDLILFCVWLFAIFLKAGVFAFGAVHFTCAVVPKLGAHKGWVGLALAVLLFTVSRFTTQNTALHSFMIDFAAIPALIIQCAMPLLALTAAIVGRRRQNKGAKTAVKAKSEEGDL